MTRAFIVVVLITLSIGCVRVDMSDSEPSLGEQLRDLTNAYDQGLLTEDEFVTLRQELVYSVLR